MSDKPKKVRRPKGERPKPNEEADAKALEKLGGELPEDDSKKRRPKDKRPIPNAKAEAKANARVEKIGEGGAAYIVSVDSIDSKRGKLRKGADVFPHYFAGGTDTIAVLLNLKQIERKP